MTNKIRAALIAVSVIALCGLTAFYFVNSNSGIGTRSGGQADGTPAVGAASSAVASSAAASSAAASSAAGSGASTMVVSEGTAATPATEVSEQHIVISFAVWEEEIPTYKQLADAFHEKNPGITIQVVPLDPLVPPMTLESDATQTLTIQNPLFSLPAVTRGVDTAAIEVSSEAVAKGYVLDLAPLAQADPRFDKGDFYTGTLALASHGSTLFMLPSYMRVTLLNYNKDLFASSGVQPPNQPWSWSDLTSAAQKLALKSGAKVERYGIVDGLNGSPALIDELVAAGVDLDPPEASKLERPEVVQALDRVAELARTGALYVPDVSQSHPTPPPPGSIQKGNMMDPGSQAVVDGKAGIWPTDLLVGRESDLHMSIGTFTMGSLPVALEGYAISKGSQHPQQAWRWLSFLSTQDISWVHGGPSPNERVPVRRSVAYATGYWQNLDSDTRQVIGSLLQSASGAGSKLVHLNWLRFNPDLLATAVAAVVQGRQTSAQALDDAQTAIDRLAPPDASAGTPFSVATIGPDETTVSQGQGTEAPSSEGKGETTSTTATATLHAPIAPTGVGSSGGGVYTETGLPDVSLDQFYEYAFRNLQLRDPEGYTQIGLSANYASDFHNDTLTNLSDAFTRETYTMTRQYLTRLRAYDPGAQSVQQLLSTKILDWYLDDQVRGEEFMYYDYLVNPLFGVQNNIQDFMTNVHPIRNKQDAQMYITRLQAFDRKFAGLLEVLRIREQKGILPPRNMIAVEVDQMKGFVSLDAKANALYTSFTERVDPLTDLTTEEKAGLYTDAAKAIHEHVYPAYQSLIEYLVQLEPKGRDTDGVWALPNGDAYYSYILRHQTTTDLTPEQIHQMGLSEVARVQGEMRKALANLGYPTDNLREAMQLVANASGYHQTNTLEQRQQLLSDYRNLISNTSGNLGDLFDIRPRADIQVLAVPSYRESGAPVANYVPPSLDGTRPGAIYINLGKPVANYQMPSLSYHEGVPGHHFQLGIQTELTGVPTFRRALILSGFAEGWAVYTERLAAEAGFYKDDRFGYLGELQGELGRALRMVVDTGIHYKRWTRQQAIDYMLANGASSEGAVQYEVDRYIAWPGQATTYGVGSLKILELRELAKQDLGSKFDLKEFHDVVLQNGGMPLDILEQVVNGYIAAKQNR